MQPIVLFGIVASALVLVGVGIARTRVVAQPDEWLLSIRNGKLVRAGVGIRIWRVPGDVVARFTSTMQRVSFAVDALSRERLRVSISGFMFWSVSARGTAPFTAFQKLGLVNLDAPPRDLKSSKHLLSTPQHRAFRQLLGAAVQRLAATRSLEDLLLRQDAFVIELRAQLTSLEEEMGIRLDPIELSQVHPVDDALLAHMSATIEENVREEAGQVRLAAKERSERRAIESAARLAHERAEARRQAAETEKLLRLAQVAHEREVKLREQAAISEQALLEEASNTSVAAAALEREELQFVARLDRTRREAETTGHAITLVNLAEEKKSQPVRDHELARLVAEKVGDALKALPIQEARWVTVGPDTPASSLAGLIAAGRELTSSGPKAA